MSEIQSASEIISSIFNKNIGNNVLTEVSELASGWNEILISLQSSQRKNKNLDGSNLADHSRIIDIKNNILIIETDHPGWIQLHKLYERTILKKLSLKFPTLKIRTIGYVLKKEYDYTEDRKTSVKEEMDKMIEMQCKTAEAYEKSIQTSEVELKRTVPDEIRNFFAHFGK